MFGGAKFVYPVYSGRPPSFVETFIQGMDLSQNPDAYYFTAATFGGTQGNAFYTIDKLLKGKGLKLQNLPC